MSRSTSRQSGFSLIELMVVVIVIAILAGIAAPSFIALRQRQTLDGVGQEVLGVWQTARMEAAKQNKMVKVGVYTASGKYCIGAATTTSETDSTPCDCTTAGACDVANFPRATDSSAMKDWRGITINSASMGATTGVVVIEPRRTALTETGDAGAISFDGPTGTKRYRLNFLVDQMGRGVLCESTSATDRMPAYAYRRCGP